VWDEESGELHRELADFGVYTSVTALATFPSPDGQQPRLVAGSSRGHVRVYDPEAGLTLHHLKIGRDLARAQARAQNNNGITALACIASSSAAPHHPRLVSACYDGSVEVWDGETGERLGGLEANALLSVAAWKEHTGEGEHDRIAAGDNGGRVKVWDGETFTILHELDCGFEIGAVQRLLAFESAEGPTRLLVALVADFGLQVWDPEEGRLLHDGINRGCPVNQCHLFESAQGRQLLAIGSQGPRHPRHPGDAHRAFLDVWDLGEAPGRAGLVKPAHHLG
jgi:WD40 repeat protein